MKPIYFCILSTSLLAPSVLAMADEADFDPKAPVERFEGTEDGISTITYKTTLNTGYIFELTRYTQIKDGAQFTEKIYLNKPMAQDAYDDDSDSLLRVTTAETIAHCQRIEKTLSQAFEVQQVESDKLLQKHLKAKSPQKKFGWCSCCK